MLWAVLRLADGQPIGHALQPVRDLYAGRAARLMSMFLGPNLDKTRDASEVAQLWTAMNDAKNLTLLGDPAVRVVKPIEAVKKESDGVLERISATRWYVGIEPPSETDLIIGRSYHFTVRVTPEERPGAVPLRIPVSALELTVFLEAPSFWLESGGASRTLKVIRGLLREQAITFSLMPLVGGMQTVRVLAHPGAKVEGVSPAELTVSVRVAPVALIDLPEMVDRRKIPDPRPDVILYVSADDHEDGCRVSYHLTCAALGWERRALGGPTDLTGEAIARLHLAVIQAADEEDAPPPETLARLRALGAALFERLAPPGNLLRDVCKRLVGSVPPGTWSWLVVSDERAVLPWELVCAGEFLADTFVLSHWVGRQGLSLSAESPLGRLDLTHYGQRPGALDLWQSSLGGAEVAVEAEAGHLELLDPSSNCYGLHVLRYAEVPRPGQVAEAPGEDRVAESEVRGRAESMVHERRLEFAQRRPVVGLSFVDDTGPGQGVHGSMRDVRLEAGWVLPLLRAGATAIVGPRWPVRPESDRMFFETFYGEARSGRTLGESAWNARCRVRLAFPGRGDWLSYAYFGHPRCEPYRVRPSGGFALFEAVGHPEGEPFHAGALVEFRASYRSTAPVWFDGPLRAPRGAEPRTGLSVMVVPMTAVSAPQEVPLEAVAEGDDCQGTVTVRMPEAGETLPLVVRFQRGDEELQTLMLTLKIGRAGT